MGMGLFKATQRSFRLTNRDELHARHSNTGSFISFLSAHGRDECPKIGRTELNKLGPLV
jgi:hypothetical protein